MSHPIRPLSCLQSAVFLINSPSHLVTATPDCSIRKGLHHQERTFSRSYGSILPSSFTRVLSSALVFSTRPPVSVWGTMTCNLKLRGFSWKQGINGFRTVVRSSRVSVLCLRICLETPPTHFHQDNRRLAHLAFSVPHRNYKSCRNINLLPIDYAFRPHLRGRLTLPRLTLDRNPWSSGEEAFHPLYRYLRQHSHF